MDLTINGERRAIENPRRNLLSYIRFDLGLTGTKYGCGEGLCGACTILVDGQPLKSCMSTVGAVCRRLSYNHRRHRDRHGASPGTTSIHRRVRDAMRLLHPWIHHGYDRPP